MIRGTATFVCYECGHKFTGLDIEWNATVFSQPQKCPKCGSMHTRPCGLFGFINLWMYKKIWQQCDERNNS